MEKKWKKITSEVVLDTPWYPVRKDAVQLPNGTVIPDYYVSELPSVVMSVPITEDGNLIFVRQYRYPIDKTLLEFPAGTYDPKNEQPEDAVKRELLEETGYESSDWEKIGRLFDYPTKDSHHIDIFVARNVERVQEPSPDMAEQIEIVSLSISDVEESLGNEEMSVAGTIAAFTMAMKYIKKRKWLDSM